MALARALMVEDVLLAFLILWDMCVPQKLKSDEVNRIT